MNRRARRGSRSFELVPRGPFSLAASVRFLEGFASAASAASATGQLGHLHLAFPVQGSGEPVAVCLREEQGRVFGEMVGDEMVGDGAPAGVQAQVRRLLSLDVDATDFGQVGERDPVAGDLQRRYPGLRPVGFWSPYEAACWAVLSQRVRIVQAARLKSRIGEQHGQIFEIHGDLRHAFPPPGRLLEVDSLGGVSATKLSRLHAVARATSAGQLDADRLRALPPDEALLQLQELPGVGPFSAELILIRGAMAPDVFAIAERRLHASMRDAYALPADTPISELAAIADAWRPYRTWISLLFRTAREEDTGEISGRRR